MTEQEAELRALREEAGQIDKQLAKLRGPR